MLEFKLKLVREQFNNTCTVSGDFPVCFLSDSCKENAQNISKCVYFSSDFCFGHLSKLVHIYFDRLIFISIY